MHKMDNVSAKSRILKLQERTRMGAFTCSRLQATLSVSCLAVMVMAAVSERVVAATPTPLAQVSTTNCPHPLDKYGYWKPTRGELNRILVRHRGWLQKEWHIDLINPDAYLDHVEPDWRSTALEATKQANLCNADLEDEHLDGAILAGADLRGARLQHLSGAHLNGADLRGANLVFADLNGAYLGIDTSLNRGKGQIISPFQLRGADLSDADLTKASLVGAHLTRANLKGAYLQGATWTCMKGHDGQLHCAELVGSDLSDANMSCMRITVISGKSSKEELRCTDLSGATLSYAKLVGTDLRGASLSKAKLNSADLSRADLSCFRVYSATPTGSSQKCVDLIGADLSGAQVSEAKIAGVDLRNATYTPVSEPPYLYVAGIKDLDKLDVRPGELTGLVQLRKLLQDAGLDDEVREATYSIQRAITVGRLSSQFLSFAWIEGVLRIVGFEWTTGYGLHPEWALRWIVLIGAILTPVYLLTLLHPTQKSRIIRVFPKNRVDPITGDSAFPEREKVVGPTNWWSALGWASYFSLLSAVNIGFEQFTPGDWIRRLQSRDYSLQAVGWVRTVAGAQAVISVYLLAMWILTQFGRPFG